MSKIFKNKWIVFLVCLVAFMLIDIDVQNVSLTERGIVLGIGIDKESDEYIVTSEILVPSNLGAENYQKNRLLIIERGKTLEEAFEKMDKALGVRISLRHTVLIVLGESMMADFGPLLDLFVGNDVSDNTYIVGIMDTAKSLFDAKPPLYSTISYKIAETFRSPDIEGGVVTTNIKDFFRMYLAPSHTIYMPVIEIDKGNMSESNGKGEDKETDSIGFGKIAVLDKRGLAVVLNEKESEGISYIYSNVNEANLYVDSTEGANGFDMDIINTKTTLKYDTKNKCVTIDTKMWVKMGHKKSDAPTDYLQPFSARERELAGKTIENTIKSAYLRCHENGADILGIATGFYRQMGKAYKDALGEDYLSKINVEVDVTLIVK